MPAPPLSTSASIPRIEIRSVPRVNSTVPSGRTRRRKSSLPPGALISTVSNPVVPVSNAENGPTRPPRSTRYRVRTGPPVDGRPSGPRRTDDEAIIVRSARVVDDGEGRVRRIAELEPTGRVGERELHRLVALDRGVVDDVDGERAGSGIAVEPAEGAVTSAVVGGRLRSPVTGRVVHRDRAVGAPRPRHRDGRNTHALDDRVVGAVELHRSRESSSSPIDSVAVDGLPSVPPDGFESERPTVSVPSTRLSSAMVTKNGCGPVSPASHVSTPSAPLKSAPVALPPPAWYSTVAGPNAGALRTTLTCTTEGVPSTSSPPYVGAEKEKAGSSSSVIVTVFARDQAERGARSRW